MSGAERTREQKCGKHEKLEDVPGYNVPANASDIRVHWERLYTILQREPNEELLRRVMSVLDRSQDAEVAAVVHQANQQSVVPSLPATVEVKCRESDADHPLPSEWVVSPMLNAHVIGGVQPCVGEPSAALPGWYGQGALEGAYTNALADPGESLGPDLASRSEGAMNNVRGASSIDARDWNAEFQECLDRITDDQILTEESTFLKLSSLASDFVTAATTYGKIIISEKHLPYDQKTIKPSRSFGGIAGGEKYLVHGILFKFAIDWRGLYGGSDEGAAKVAGHDLNGLKAVYNTGVSLSVPLMVLIEYRGFLLTAMSRLPIGPDTIRYGSMDGGVTVHDSAPQLKSRMVRLASALGLKAHGVTGSPSGEAHDMPCDLEGHLSMGRYYAVDFSRLMPPAPPRRRQGCSSRISSLRKADHLTRLLRPELLRSNAVPLSADAFSYFEKGKEDRSDVIAAHVRLHDEIIPAFAEWLCGHNPYAVVEHQSPVRQWTGDEGYFLTVRSRLSEYMHKAGINMRCLGDVWRCSGKHLRRFPSHAPLWREVLMEEMIARTLRQLWRARLRAETERMSVPSEFPYKCATMAFLNLVLGDSDERRAFWLGELRDEVLERFFTDSPQERMTESGSGSEFGMKDDVDGMDPSIKLGKYFEEWSFHTARYPLRSDTTHASQAASHMSDDTSLSQLLAVPEDLLTALGRGRPEWDRLKSVLNRFLELTGVRLSRGHALDLDAKSDGRPVAAVSELGERSSEGRRELKYSKESIKLRSTPSTPAEVLSCATPLEETDIADLPCRLRKMNIVAYAEGTALFIKARRRTGPESDRLALLASERFDDALRDVEDPATLCNYGFLCDHLRDHAAAEGYYRRAIASNPLHARSLYYYAMLQERHLGNPGRAGDFYLEAIRVNPRHTNALKDYGNYLARRERPEEAEKYYLRALEVDPHHPRALLDYSHFKWRSHSDADSALQLLERAVHVVSGHDVAESESEGTPGPVGKWKMAFDPRRQKLFWDMCVALLRKLANHYSRLGVSAVPELQRVVDIWLHTRPTSADIYRNLAKFAKGYDHELCQNLYEKAIQVDSGPQSYLAFARFKTDILKDVEGATTLYQQMMEHFPSHKTEQQYRSFLKHVARLRKETSDVTDATDAITSVGTVLNLVPFEDTSADPPSGTEGQND